MGTSHHTRPTRTGSGSRGLTAVEGPPVPTHIRKRTRPNHRILAGLVVVAALLSLLGLSQVISFPQTIAATVDGTAYRFTTTQRTVGSFLDELGIDPRDLQRVSPAPDRPLTKDTVVEVVRARPVVITDGGREYVWNGNGATLNDALTGVGLTLGQRDVLRVGPRDIPPTAALATLRTETPADAALYASAAPQALQSTRTTPAKQFSPLPPVPVAVDRAIPVVMHERGQITDVPLRGATLREALANIGAPILPNDKVQPDPDGPVTAGLHVFIHRARDVTLTVDRKPVALRSRAATIADLLAEQSVQLEALDRVEPPLAMPLRDNTQVKVVRVRELEVVEDEVLTVATDRIPDENLDFGATEVKVHGSDGLRRYFYRVRIEDGEEVSRDLVDNRLVRDPITRVVHYGTKPPTVETNQGPMSYIRKVRVWATWYDASHGGKPRSSPAYGLTALGVRATRGIMAVDPSFIPYRTTAWVPGYGVARAMDTGGGLRGAHIDLAFDEDEPKTWSTRYVDIYILGTPTQADAYRAAFGDE